jgi:hypothetical protein
VEESPTNTLYTTAFYNFNIEWLTDGNDHLQDDAIAETQAGDSLGIYPNPASSTVRIEVEGFKKLKIYNLKGQTVKKVSVKGQTEVEVDIAKLPSGTYMVEAIDFEGNTKNGKFVIDSNI